MSHRSAPLYELIFKYLRDDIKISPTDIMCDFERAMKKAANSVWQNCQINGCLFHYRQALSRRARKEKNLSKKLNKNSSARVALHLFMNLSFLPEYLIYEGLEVIYKFQKSHKLFKAFKSFNKYFEKNWIHRLNFCSSDLNLLTNNVCEGFNSKLKKIIITNPSTLSFLGK